MIRSTASLSWLLAALAGVCVLIPATVFGADDLGFDEDLERPFETKVSTPLIGEYVTFAGMSPVVLQGYGLVVGLNGTGGDPAPSAARTALLEELKRLRVSDPNTLLRSPNTALVKVTTFLPPVHKAGGRLDVLVEAPPNAGVKDLKGGWLMETLLYEQAIVPGNHQIQGFAYAKATGPIIVGSLSENSGRDPMLNLRGRVLGAAVVTKERDLSVHLRNDFRSVRNSARIAEVIGTRFHGYDRHGIKIPMAEAKTDRHIILRIDNRYRDNYPHYLQVIRHLAFREDNVARRLRLQQLQKELMEPRTAERASLQLEAIGNDAIPVLKTGLKAPTIECRIYAAVALAYLGESECIETLGIAARDERAFRVFALAAMSAIDEADTHLKLRDLMSESSSETRYGAFRALWTLDRNDPFIRGITMKGGGSNSTSEYMLHVLPTQGDELAHVTLHSHPEIVLFGEKQEMRPPLLLTAGRHIMVTAQAGSKTVSLARFEPGKPDERREVSMRLADVLMAADELGATYPDLFQMLVEASRQRNLPTRLAIDALPTAGRVYHRPGTKAAPNAQPARIGKEIFTPNLFPQKSEDEDARTNPDAVESEESSPMASIIQTSAEVPAQGEVTGEKTESETTVSKDESAPAQSDDPPSQTAPTESEKENSSTPRRWWHVFGSWRKSKDKE